MAEDQPASTANGKLSFMGQSLLSAVRAFFAGTQNQLLTMRCWIISLPFFVVISCTSKDLTSPSSPSLPPPGGSPNIFKRYSIRDDAEMMGGWSRNFDMSGISFNEKMTLTLVTRRHVVMAYHYRRKPGAKAVFHNRAGEKVERTLVSVTRVVGDVAVGLLDSDVPLDLKVYSLPRPRENFSHLKGATAAVTDQNRRIFFHEIDRVSPTSIAFRHPKLGKHGWGKNLVKGDSGNPSFLISGEELVLIETHTSGGGGSGPFYGSPLIQKKLSAAISNLAPGYQLRLKSL